MNSLDDTKEYIETMVKREAEGTHFDYAFESLHLHKLYASVVNANVGSARGLEKNCFVLEGEFRDHYFIEETNFNTFLFGKIQTKKEQF